MNTISLVAYGVVIKNNKYLLTQRTEPTKTDYPFEGYWQVPGGGLEFGESPEETVVRELREELGVDVEVVKLIPNVFTIKGKKWQGVFLSYLCKLRDETDEIVINSEATDYRWVSLEDVKSLQCLPSTEEVLKAVENMM
jgi:8-oxo-dGTP diphosphatase